jgi:hypothetical protein
VSDVTITVTLATDDALAFLRHQGWLVEPVGAAKYARDPYSGRTFDVTNAWQLGQAVRYALRDVARGGAAT